MVEEGGIGGGGFECVMQEPGFAVGEIVGDGDEVIGGKGGFLQKNINAGALIVRQQKMYACHLMYRVSFDDVGPDGVSPSAVVGET